LVIVDIFTPSDFVYCELFGSSKVYTSFPTLSCRRAFAWEFRVFWAYVALEIRSSASMIFICNFIFCLISVDGMKCLFAAIVERLLWGKVNNYYRYDQENHRRWSTNYLPFLLFSMGNGWLSVDCKNTILR